MNDGSRACLGVSQYGESFIHREIELGAWRVVIEQLVPIGVHLLERVNAMSLTTRRKEIVRLSLRGLPNAQIARQLSIGPRALKDSCKGIHARLDINSHHELVQRLACDAMPVST